MEALRRRVEELELENALMREVVEVVKKDPGADLRRLSNREKTMPVDRLRPRYSLRSMVYFDAPIHCQGFRRVNNNCFW